MTEPAPRWRTCPVCGGTCYVPRPSPHDPGDRRRCPWCTGGTVTEEQAARTAVDALDRRPAQNITAKQAG